MKRLFFALLLLLAPSLFAQDFFQVDPLTPKEGDEIELRIGGSWPSVTVPSLSRVSIDGKTITIDFNAPPVGPISVVAPWGERVNVGRLEDGTYTVVVRISGIEHDRHTFTVEPQTFRVTPSFGGEYTQVLIEGVPLVECFAPACLSVHFGDRPATDVALTPEHGIIATAPVGLSGTVPVVVAVAGEGTYTQPNAFRYEAGDPLADMERVLLPVNFYGPGAHGSQWQTDTVVRNDGPVYVPTEPLFWADPRVPVIPIPTPIPPGARGYFPWRNDDGGAFLWVPRGLEDQLSYSMHVLDRSRNELDRGTELPIVHAGDTSPFVRILDVPSDANYRAKLRVYNFDPVNGARVEIKLHDQNGGQPVTLYATLNGVPVCSTTPCIPDRPAYASVDLPQLTGGPFDVTVRAETNDVRLWAFVTVTNNETQHVTAYTPQHSPRGQ